MSLWEATNKDGKLQISIFCGNDGKRGEIIFWLLILFVIGVPFFGVFRLHAYSLFATIPISILLLKPIFWNRYGYEYWGFKKKSFTRYQDFKLLKPKVEWLAFDQLDLNYVVIKSKVQKSDLLDEELRKYAVLKVKTEDNNFKQSIRKLPLSDIQEICKVIATFYGIEEKTSSL